MASNASIIAGQLNQAKQCNVEDINLESVIVDYFAFADTDSTCSDVEEGNVKTYFPYRYWVTNRPTYFRGMQSINVSLPSIFLAL